MCVFFGADATVKIHKLYVEVMGADTSTKESVKNNTQKYKDSSAIVYSLSLITFTCERTDQELKIHYTYYAHVFCMYIYVLHSIIGAPKMM